LFASAGVDLKTPLRSGATDGDLRAIIGDVWTHRRDRYSELRAGLAVAADKVEMYYIGG
jgi:cyclic pyranopterin phosphate synthase